MAIELDPSKSAIVSVCSAYVFRHVIVTSIYKYQGRYSFLSNALTYNSIVVGYGEGVVPVRLEVRPHRVRVPGGDLHRDVVVGIDRSESMGEGCAFY